jgi:hypothetical protein
MNGPIQQEHLSLASLFSLVKVKTLAYWADSLVTKNMMSCEYGPKGGIHKTSFSSKLMN